jgi:hypothetical protein
MSEALTPKIFISYPVMVAPEMTSFISMQEAIRTCGYPVKVQYEVGDSFITRVRNNQVSQFLAEKEWTHYMSWDSDLVFYPTAECKNPIRKLVENDVSFCAALYACKDAKVKRVATNGFVGHDKIAHNTGLHEARWQGGGMWCVKREVIEDMAKLFPDLEYDAEEQKVFPIYGLFNPMIVNRRLLSEDWAFCERYASICGRMFYDTSIVLGHVGRREFFVWGEPV